LTEGENHLKKPIRFPAPFRKWDVTTASWKEREKEGKDDYFGSLLHLTYWWARAEVDGSIPQSLMLTDAASLRDDYPWRLHFLTAYRVMDIRRVNNYGGANFSYICERMIEVSGDGTRGGGLILGRGQDIQDGVFFSLTTASSRLYYSSLSKCGR